MNPWVVGVDLGGTKIELGLIDPQDRIVARRRIPTLPEQGPESTVERIAGLVSELGKELPGGQKISALGICCPGPLDHEAGVLINPTNLPKFYNVPLRQMLAEALQIPVSMEHDAKAAGLGEFYYGAGRGQKSMIYTVIGTGVGSAILVDGQLIRGARNFAGEGGHTTVDPDGELCPCGSRGCVDTFTSGPWLARRYQRLLDAVPSQDRPQIAEPVTGELVSRLASNGEPLARRIMDEAGRAVGIMVATMAMILDIELFVFGGSVSKSGDLLFEPARHTVPQYAFKSVSSRVRILPAELGDNSALLGCAWQARQTSF